MAHTLDQYAQMHTQQPKDVKAFTFPDGNERMLEVNFGVQGSNDEPVSLVWIKQGSMVAYRGEVSFRRENVMQHGVGTMLKKALVTNEGTKLTQATAEGTAQLYLAHKGKEITIFKLQGDSITVNGYDVLAFESSVTQKIRMVKSVSSMMSAGLYNIHLSGHGLVAILTEGSPITLMVGSGMPPVYTDPDATVAWSGDLSPELKTDIQFKSLFGRGSGESFQMKFDGEKGPPGFILVQPSEEHVPS